MILEELTIRSWRGYRESHGFRFEEGFNLIVGRNEAGKSTLFEALTRVLFDRHTAKTEEIRRIQPLGSSLGHEAALVFRADGRRYQVVKRFLQRPICELYSDRRGLWERDHEGDRADAELRAILRGEAAGRAAKPEHRGLAQALWYLQREDPLPERAWTEGIKQGLSGLVQLVAKSPEEDRIVRLIEDAYATYYTPTGRLASASELERLQQEIPKVEGQLSDLRARTEAVERLRSDLEDLTERKAEKGARMQDAHSELEGLQQALEAADAVEEQKRQQEKAVQDVGEKLRRLSSDQEMLSRRVKKLEELGRDLEGSREASESLEADARQERLAADRHHERWKHEHEPALQQVEGELLVLRAVERLRHLEKDRERLQDYLSRLRKAEDALQEKKRELALIRAPSKKEWDAFHRHVNELRVAEAQAEPSAIRVGFDLEDTRASVIATPEAQRTSDGEEFFITAPTTFAIGGVGTVRVRGGGASLEELDAKARQFRSLVKATLERFEVDDAQALSDLHQQRSDLDREVKRLQERRDELAGEEEDPEGELARVERGIDEEAVKSKAAPHAWMSWGGQKIREKAEELEQEKAQLIRAIAEEQHHEQQANTAYLECVKKAQAASNRVAGLQSQIKSLEQENAAALKVYGTLEHLAILVMQATDELRCARDDLDTLMQDYEARVEVPRKLHQQTVEYVRALEYQSGQLQQHIVDRKARIEEAAAQGLYSQTADLEADLEVKRRRLESVKRRAEATRLLRDVVLAHRKGQSVALIGPVSELVNKWLRLLTEDAYDALALNEELLPVAVRSNRYGEPLPLDSLSYGTHEQVIVLLRLAIGVLLSQRERNLVVIDDRLVNADAVRMKRLCLILQEVASNACQVVVATCNDTPYAGIRGHVIRVPADGRAS